VEFTFKSRVQTPFGNQRFLVAGDVVSATITTATSTTTTQGSPPVLETMAAGAARQGPFGDRIRIREKVSGVSGSPTGPTYTVTAWCADDAIGSTRKLSEAAIVDRGAS
jgi:hypothetical protein